jgi:ATP dependent DNA ligase-like protein
MTDDMDKCRWLAPRLVAAVEFLEWTPDFRLRHPRFGLALTFEIFRGGCIGDPDQ